MDREVVLQTVKGMLEAGIDEEMIRDTLTDSGFSKAEIEDVISEASGKKPLSAAKPQAGKPTFASTIESPHEVLAQKTAEKVKEHIADFHEESALRDTMTHAALEEHGAKLEEVHKKVEELHEKIEDFPKAAASLPDAAKKIESKLNKFEKDLGELKAANSALQDLLKKILETNRELLIKLEKKKQ